MSEPIIIPRHSAALVSYRVAAACLDERARIAKLAERYADETIGPSEDIRGYRNKARLNADAADGWGLMLFEAAEVLGIDS